MRDLRSGDEEFAHKMDEHRERIERALERVLPSASKVPQRLHEAMRYAVLQGGKRIRPLLTYAAGESLDVDPAKLDIPGTAIELLHAFSLVHDDLPAMDDDDLRRGQPTVHRKFDEATAILAADALQPLAFQTIAASDELDPHEARSLTILISEACGSIGMTGGQAIDLASEGKALTAAELSEMYRLKTGALIRAAVMSPCYLTASLVDEHRLAMEQFAHDIGLAFQIRDDILDITGKTDVIGKPVGSDQRMGKATWPSVFGVEESIRRCDELLASAIQALAVFGQRAETLRRLANLIVERVR